MNPPDSDRPQVAVLSTHADRERLRPFVEGARQRGIRLWWDATDFLPGEEWRAKVEEIVASTPILCLGISARALSSSNFQQVLEQALQQKSRIVPLRLEALSPDSMPRAIAERLWIDLLAPNDVTAACDQLLRLVQTGEVPAEPAEPRSQASHGQLAQGAPSQRKAPRRPEPKSSSSATSREAPEPIGRSSGMQLVLGDATAGEEWPMTPQLQTLLENAVQYRNTSGYDQNFPVSFRMVLMGIFYAAGAWSQWAIGLASNTGFDRPGLGALPIGKVQVPSPLRTTRSVASLLHTARDYANRAGTMLDVHHLIAAVVFAPAGHEGELASYGFDQLAWANELVREVTSRFPADAPVIRQLRDEAFPVTRAPEQEQRQENAPSSTTQPDIAQRSGSWWEQATADLKSALSWSAGAAASKPGSVVEIRELVGGLIRRDDPRRLASRLLEAAGIDDRTGSPWLRIHETLSLPQLPSWPQLQVAPTLSSDVEALLARAVAMRPLPTSSLDGTLVFLATFRPEFAGDTAPVDPLLNELGADADKFLGGVESEISEVSDLVRGIRGLRRKLQSWERPHVDNDLVGGAIPPDRDLLDARKPALRFAKLLAARDVAPPIALGLFGNWGSGKTFFMGLMRNQIADLTKTGGDGYVRRVVQIEFNAWHYHDTNLWASLAVRIFEGLAKELGGEKPSDVEKKRKELHQKISSSATRRDEAVEIRRLALERRGLAAQELEKTRTKRDEKLKQRERLQMAAAWRVVTTSERFERLRDIASRLAHNFGLPAAIDSAETIQELEKNVEEVRHHALGIFTAIGRRFHGLGASIATVTALAFVLLAALALGWVVEWVDGKVEMLNFPQFSGTVVQVATLVSTVAAWCGCRVRELRGALDSIQAVEKELERAVQELVPDDNLKALQAEIAKLDQEIHKRTEEVSAAEREIAEATAEIDRINRGGLVYDFLQERSASSSYVGQLGLISTIRQDFEKLDVLLNDFVAHGENPIERIVLYIDDLDRCHPDKVVEVLQAVHLMLAFDLFNVVVGVDARWLERSLFRQYVGGAKDGLPQPEDPFSPQDYLEKIFQIPYALAPIDENAFKTLISGLIETRSKWREKERERQKEELKLKTREESKTEAKDATSEQKSPSEAGQQRESDSETRGNGDEGDKSSGDSNNGSGHKEEEKISPGSSKTVLFFEDHEREFIELLHAFIDRPRLAKRFVNIYRLLRVRADDEQESARFAASPTSDDFRAALVLLAIQVGHPTVGAKVAMAIETAAKGRTWPTLLNDLSEGTCDSVVCTDREREEFAKIMAKLAKVGTRIPGNLDSYRLWSPRVSCFSFDWHRGLRNPAAASVPKWSPTNKEQPAKS